MLENLDISFLRDFSKDIISNNIVKIRAGGNSMYPFIKKGTVLIIEKVEFSTLKKGDVVVFKGGEKLIAHRLIRFVKTENAKLLLCKGDSRSSYDAPFGADKYIGKVIGKEKENKYIAFNTRLYVYYNCFLAFISPFTPIIYNTIRFFKHTFFKVFKTN